MVSHCIPCWSFNDYSAMYSALGLHNSSSQHEQGIQERTFDGTTQTASMIQNMFESMSGVEGELTFVDEDNYVAIFKLHSEKEMSMMVMNP